MSTATAPRPGCTHCGGSGMIRVSKDPDEIDDCVCTDPVDPVHAAKFAEEASGIELLPWQLHVMERALAGDQIVVGTGRHV
ncbi:hypothetical protein [Microbacterium sp. J1-1]|uniref:hypothetical protein n=1 Tax=Microbacterium sp. J1-1 TaxID=2992441 RepID=UPI002115BB99|nr:hypothetical protein [Microbacterium sp. J1-1]UUE19341.1 hypothetical protein LRQ07_11020 [Microbacterium sp. J1-1]